MPERAYIEGSHDDNTALGPFEGRWIMTSEEIEELVAARENLVKRRREVTRQVAAAPLPSVEMADELTRIFQAIEALDRVLNDAGRPYMSEQRSD